MGKREDNLKPFKKGRSSEEAKIAGSLGGKASGKSRRLAATFREAAIALLNEEKKLKDENGKVVGKTNGREALMGVLMRQAVKGNIKAIDMMLSIAGEGTAQKIEVTGKEGQDLFKGMTNKELDARMDELMKKLK